MSNFPKWVEAIHNAKSFRRLNNLKMEIIQDRSLIPMEYVHLGSLAGTKMAVIKPQNKKATL